MRKDDIICGAGKPQTGGGDKQKRAGDGNEGRAGRETRAHRSVSGHMLPLRRRDSGGNAWARQVSQTITVRP